MRVVLPALLGALLLGGAGAYLALSISASAPNFHVVGVSAAGPCEGPAGYRTSCPLQAVLRNDGGSGTALLEFHGSVYNALTDQGSTTTCTTAVPRANHGDVVKASCVLLAGQGSWLRGVPTVEVRN